MKNQHLQTQDLEQAIVVEEVVTVVAIVVATVVIVVAVATIEAGAVVMEVQIQAYLK